MILVTGANGLVGSALVKKFVQEKIPVRGTLRHGADRTLLNGYTDKIEVVETDVLDTVGLLNAVQGVDTVIHTAALVSFNPRRREEILDINVTGTRNVVNACLKNGVRKLIHISSIAALGRHKDSNRVDETTKWTGELQSDYGESKHQAELEAFRGQEEGLQVSIVNPSVILTAGDGERSSSQLFGYVKKGNPFYANYLINYVDVRDVVEMIFRLSQREGTGERFIANAGTIDLGTLLGEIAKRLKKKPPSVKVPPALVKIAATAELWRSRLTGKEPLISRQTVRLLNDPVTFENGKAIGQLGIQFQSLENSLDWCCGVVRNDNINN